MADNRSLSWIIQHTLQWAVALLLIIIGWFATHAYDDAQMAIAELKKEQRTIALQMVEMQAIQRVYTNNRIQVHTHPHVKNEFSFNDAK